MNGEPASVGGTLGLAAAVLGIAGAATGCWAAAMGLLGVTLLVAAACFAAKRDDAKLGRTESEPDDGQER